MTHRFLAALAATIALGAFAAWAADEPVNRGMAHRFTDLTSMTVENSTGEKLGKIIDVVVDQGSGKIRYAAVSFGGFLGVGDKLFAVPWAALKHENDTVNGKHRVVMSADKKSLENAPGFDANNWPDVADPKWAAEVDKFYGDAHGIKADASAGPGIRLSKVNGMEVRNAAGEKLGSVEDTVLDIDKAQVRYIAISFGGFLGVGDKLFAVPFSAAKLADNGQGKDYHLVMNIDKATLEKAPSFDKSRWPNMADPSWNRVDEHYGTKPTQG